MTNSNATEEPINISVVVPAYNEVGILQKTIDTIVREMESIGTSFELLIVDDGSTDGTAAYLREIGEADPRVVPVVLSRNFGKESAMQAGLDASLGKAVILIDADLQHPPELIHRMVELWNEGYEVVNAVKAKRGREPFAYRISAWLFNAMLSSAIRHDDLHGASDFKLLDREVVDALKECAERGRFLRGLVAWVGFKHIGVEFDVVDRAEGQSKWSVKSLLVYTIKNFMAFSSLPLRIVAAVGFATVAVGLIMALQTFAIYLSGDAVSGFTTVIVLLVIFSGVILSSLGVIALYLALVYDEQKARPPYVIRKGTRQNGMRLDHEERPID